MVGDPAVAPPSVSSGPDVPVAPPFVQPGGEVPPLPAGDGLVAPAPGAPTGGQVISGGFDASASSLPGTIPPPTAAGSGFPTTSTTPTSPGIVVGGTDPAAAAAAPPPASRRSLKPLLIALVAVLIIGGGSAAAYFGVIVPNKPANVLKTAFINSIQQTQVSTSGTAETTGFKAAFTTAANTSTKSVDVTLNLTFSGATFPVEGRLIGHNFYFKVGDLTTITSLLQAYSPNAGTIAQTLNSQVANKWIVVDSTIIDQQPSLKCVLDTSWTLNKADINLLESQYGQHAFTTIQSTSSDTVNGKSAEKFVLSLDDNKSTDFAKGLNNLSIIKALNSCSGSSAGATSLIAPSDHKTTPLTVWVDKGTKRIVQIGASNKNGSTTIKLSYAPVSITAPSNPEPVLQLLGALESATGGNTGLSQLFGGSSTGTTN
jgi:hypothetical protein